MELSVRFREAAAARRVRSACITNGCGGTATAGVDFAATSGTLTWADGDASVKRIDVELFDDTEVESDESFRIRLSNPTGGVTIHHRDRIVVIEDNDIQGRR